jgi:tetratricopeptide (TPR) repeat protein
MNFLIPLIVIVILFGVTAIVLWINTLVHEMGHALVMHCFTKGRVSMFLGTYGDKEKSFYLRVGRFDIWIKRNMMFWGGLCRTDEALSNGKYILMVLAGPLASLLLCVFAFILLYSLDWEGAWVPVAYLGIVGSFISFISNLIPWKHQTRLHDGTLINNDGRQLVVLWQIRRLPQEFMDASVSYAAEDFNKASLTLKGILQSGYRKPAVYRLAICAAIMEKDFSTAEAMHQELIVKHVRLNDDDHTNWGLIMLYQKRHEEALGYFKKLLVTSGLTALNLNIVGYLLNVACKYDEAIGYLNDAIAADGAYALAYGNRAYAKMQLGHLDEGLTDHERCLKLEPEPKHGYDYRNQGLYLLRRGDYSAALSELERAAETDPEIPGLNELLEEAKQKLQPMLALF